MNFPDQPEAEETLATATTGSDGSARIAPAAAHQSSPTVQPNPPSSYPPARPGYVYAIGRIEPRLPNIAVEKEIMQATGRADATGLTDRQALAALLSQPENRYLVRGICWVMTIQELDTYIVTPRDPVDLNLLVEALRPEPKPSDLDVVIGMKGPIAPPDMCNGLLVPVVGYNQIFFFDRDALIDAIPRPDKIGKTEFPAAAAELFDRIIHMADNAGATDEDRALNYLAMRYPAIYAHAAGALARNESLTAIEVIPSRLSGPRTVMDVIFSYTSRDTDVTAKFCVTVDVTYEHPFLIRRLSPYFDR